MHPTWQRSKDKDKTSTTHNGFVEWLVYQYKHGKERRVNRKTMTEVVVMIGCRPEQAEKTEEILWDYYAFGVGRWQG